MPDITLCADSYRCDKKDECRRAMDSSMVGPNQSCSYFYQRWQKEKTQECEYYEPLSTP